MRDLLVSVDVYSYNEVEYSHYEVDKMTKDEKLEKITKDFSLLPEDKQDYILGIMQALVFANDEAKDEAKFSDSSSAYAGEKK